ncbi:MAG: type II toxin-antitoxin system HicB family antitoxin [Phycisphaerae bacterium]
MRAVVLHRGDDGFWVAEVPSLPGCVGYGRTRTEAIANVKKAIAGWIETAPEHGQVVPTGDSETLVICV